MAAPHVEEAFWLDATANRQQSGDLCAALEAFVGSFSMALFVVAFVKKMTR